VSELDRVKARIMMSEWARGTDPPIDVCSPQLLEDILALAEELRLEIIEVQLDRERKRGRLS
jgi:hypothetical protein